MHIDRDGKCHKTIWFQQYRKGEIMPCDYEPTGSETRVWGPFEITFPAPAEVMNAIEAQRIDAEVGAVEKIKASSPKKTAGNTR
jgi:hypothetical protein